MYSLLQTIDEYIKENNISFKEITFSYTYFDSYLNQAITNRIRNMNGDYLHSGCLTYTLMYDNNGNLCLIAKSQDEKTTLVIYDKTKTTDVSLPGKYRSCTEKEIVREAAMLKFLEKDRLEKRKIIYENNPDIGVIDRVQLETKKVDILISDTLTKLNKQEKDILKTLNNKTKYEDLYVEDTYNILDYIDYLKDSYQDELNFLKMQEEEHKRMNGVCYTEPSSDPLPKTDNNLIYVSGKRDKANPVISFDERYNVLESYPYLYREYAYTTEKKEITYMNYLYNIGNNKYLLVMEPHNGNKYIKMAIFESEKEVTREEFVNKIKYYLQLSYAEGLEEKSLIRSNHTTINTFKKIMDYTILGANNGLVNEYFMGKVRRLKNK